MGDRYNKRRADFDGGPGRGDFRGGPGGPHKRRRDEDAEDGHRPLLASVIRLGDLPQAASEQSQEEELDHLYKALRRDLQNKGDLLCRIITDCAEELSVKTPVYAVLAGLLNADEHGFGEKLVARVHSELQDALKAGARNKYRMLVRFCAALTATHVLFPSAFMTLLQSLIAAADNIATAGLAADPSGRQWQAYSDHLVYIALIALPWGGAELAEGAAGELGRLFAGIDGYMSRRPRANQPALRPFYESGGPDDAPARSDSGGASFLGQVWEAVQHLAGEGKWKVASIPRLFLAFEASLATGEPHQLPTVDVPLQPPAVPAEATSAEAAATVAAAYPPRGAIRLLAPEHTRLAPEPIERLVAEEYILDTIAAFDGDRVECARRLALGLPLPAKHESLLAETLFAQMLTLPWPALKPLAYSTLMVDVCKLMPTFPRSMSACVRECFARMRALDPELRGRLAEWLAYHLSNFEFMWPWAKWAQALDAPPHDAQRRFVVATLSRLVRLSYWSRIQAVVPEPFRVLLPPRPEVRPLPAAPATEQPEANGTAVANGDVLAGDAQGDIEGQRAAEALQLVRQKAPSEGILAWAEEAGLASALGGPAGALCCVLRALLVAGAKSFTHMITVLERYEDALRSLLAAAGPGGGEAAVGAAAGEWAAAPQRAAQAIDRLMALRLVSGADIARWAFASPGLRHLGDETATSLAWEALFNAVNKTLARTQDAQDDLAAVERAVVAAEQASTMAAAAAEADHGPMALADEAAARGAVEEAQAMADQRRGELAAAVAEERMLLELVFVLFRNMLQEPRAQLAAVGEAPGPDDAATAEWRAFTLASLKAFSRRYFVAAAPLQDKLLDDILAEDRVEPALRAAVIEGLSV